MVRSLLVITYLILFMFVSMLVFPLYPILLFLRLRKAAYTFSFFIKTLWGKSLLFIAGVKVTVIGEEHVPETDSVCFVSNHQGMADILVITAYTPKVVGFIAKKELKKMPIINLWMVINHCIFIDRRNIRQAARAINKGADYIRRGYPLVLFPEGTRSRGPAMGRFKRGSIKLALKSNGVIVPVTVNGTYKLFEEHNRIRKGTVTLQFHKPIVVTTLTPKERRELPDRLAQIIIGGLHEIS